ncbi:hypothetical protein G3M48_002333 [Beauveria asiatica]|uniref:Uncharacterized protein n=1 Tax=Beauveria asiatica TaxID=1069075 RepID=A0AAW0RYT1_9HYPO
MPPKKSAALANGLASPGRFQQEEHATRITARWGVQRARLPTDGGGVVVERDSDCRTNKSSQRHQMMELVP